MILHVDFHTVQERLELIASKPFARMSYTEAVEVVFVDFFFSWRSRQSEKELVSVGGGNSNLVGGFKDFWNFHPYLGKIPNLTNIFQRGWNHQQEMFFSFHPDPCSFMIQFEEIFFRWVGSTTMSALRAKKLQPLIG